VKLLAELVDPAFTDPKEADAGDMVATAVPVPLTLMVCDPLLALSVIFTVPLRAPAAAGAKVTLMTQLPLAATDVPQVLVWE
jgi:hypothetical protein